MLRSLQEVGCIYAMKFLMVANKDVINFVSTGGAVAQLGARLDGIEEVVGSNPIGSTNCSS